MSSTLRSNLSKAERERIKDYYVTPVEKVEEFISEFLKKEPGSFDGDILDPCAGGDSEKPMSYPKAMENLGISGNVTTLDIRHDSRADIKGSYLDYDPGKKFDLIITNPPFNHAEDIIKKALEDIKDDGFVIMLQRINFYGGKARREFWREVGMPEYTFIYPRRLSFTDDKKTDSIEYAHFVWRKSWEGDYSKTYLL